MQKLGGPPLSREEKKRNFKEYLRERTKILDWHINSRFTCKVDEIFTKMFSANLKKQFLESKCGTYCTLYILKAEFFRVQLKFYYQMQFKSPN